MGARHHIHRVDLHQPQPLDRLQQPATIRLILRPGSESLRRQGDPARLGAYPRTLLEDAAWGRKPALFEYWAHEASLLPLASQPLLRWRMADARDGVGVWKGVARFMREQRGLVDSALDQVRRRGPLTAAQLELGARGAGGWWGWSEAKRAAECLFWTGELAVAGRRGTFERVYGLPERVLPRKIMATPTPSREDAQRQLILIAARAMGVATERDLRDYFRMGVAMILRGSTRSGRP